MCIRKRIITLSGMFENNNTVVSGDMDCSVVNGHSSKRRRYDDHPSHTENTSNHPTARHFLPIRKNSSIFLTQEWKSSGTSLYCPISSDTFLNIHKYDHITTGEGNFFVADETGTYSKSVRGHIVNFWKQDKSKREFYVAQSFLFTNLQDFHVVQAILMSS